MAIFGQRDHGKNTRLMCFLVGSNMGLSHPPHFPWSKLGPVTNFGGLVINPVMRMMMQMPIAKIPIKWPPSDHGTNPRH